MRPLGRSRPYNGHRLSAVVGILALSFLAIWFRLAFVQLIHHDHLSDLAARQHNRSVTLSPERGRILDRHGRVLATSVPVPSAYALPHEVEKRDVVAKQLAQTLEQPLAKIQRQLNATAPFVWLARHISPAMAEQLQALNIRGVYLLEESRRFYPKRHLAGQILGFVGIDDEGLGGLEYLYNRELSGHPRHVVIQRDATGRSLGLLLGNSAERPRGADLYLTLDERLQYIAEKELEAQVQHTRAKSGLVVIMEPSSGDILAMAGYPFFNPNDFQNPQQKPWQRNRAVTDPIEPGSTFKMVAASGALEEGAVRPTDTFFCENGVFVRGSRRLRDHHPYGTLNFVQVIEHSSNIGTVKIAERLGATRFYHYIRQFGFGEKSLVDLPGEEPGFVRAPKAWSGLSQDSLAIGQEITLTPLQLATAYGVIANGGVLMRPRMVEHIVHGEESQFFTPHERYRVLSQRTVAQMNAILTGVVDRGTGKLAAIEGYAAAGKTGTAQKVVGGGYSHSKVLASFVGFVPSEAPQLVIVAIIDEPQIEKWGGQAAAPIFKRVAEQALHYLQIPSHKAYAFTLTTTGEQMIVTPPDNPKASQVALSTNAKTGKAGRP